MKFIKDYKEGDKISDIYLCKHKQTAMTKNGKAYDNVILQDKTGILDAKIWEPHSPGIGEYEVMDYIEVQGEVLKYQGNLQGNLKRIRVCGEGEYQPENYMPMSKLDNNVMYKELLGFIDSIENPYLRGLLKSFFVEDEAFIKKFRYTSAAKTMHHSFIGGLLEHTLSVTKLSEFMCTRYPLLKRDLLLTAAMFHDIGKTRELSAFPENDYTDDGQLLGHIMIGYEMLEERIRQRPSFPKTLASELKHCILAHHGEYEYGSPKKPAIYEAVALNLADNADAKLEMLTELFGSTQELGWLGYNKAFESNMRVTRMHD